MSKNEQETPSEAPRQVPVDGKAESPVAAPKLAAADAAQRLTDVLAAWQRLSGKVVQQLREDTLDASWAEQFSHLARQVRELAQQDPDLALYVLIQSNGTQVNRYSENHAMTCLVIADLAAAWMDWSEDEKQSLALAALSMNVSMTALQNALAAQNAPLSDTQRERVDHHAALSVEMLTGAGVTDPVWLYVVEHHHTAAGPDAASDVSSGPRLAELLRRVDIYSAKLSRRGSRDSVTPAIAARDACLGADGHPDSVGATLLRVIGLYPPGTYVELANGETAVVIQRGSKAHAPTVASVRRQDWGLIKPPQRRDTSRASLSVKRGVGPGQVKVLFDHLYLLGCK